MLLLTLPNDEAGEVEIGWHLHPDAWGHGYASEAARAVLAHGFAHGLPEILAVTHLDNYPSHGRLPADRDDRPGRRREVVRRPVGAVPDHRREWAAEAAAIP